MFIHSLLIFQKVQKKHENEKVCLKQKKQSQKQQPNKSNYGSMTTAKMASHSGKERHDYTKQTAPQNNNQSQTDWWVTCLTKQ